MIDYFPDGHIDCKDYAIRNQIELRSRGIQSELVKKGKNHVANIFTHGGQLYIMDGDKLYVVRSESNSH